VSEAEVFARGGIKDVLVSNQVRDPAKIDRLARLPKLGARTICCVDDIDNVKDLSAAAQSNTARPSNASSKSTAARAAAV
jgi:3-hydroxy-D-aspartate aldolase